MSRILKGVLSSAKRLHAAGYMDDEVMREFEEATMEYDYEFYEKAWSFWTRDIYPVITGLLPPEARGLAKKLLIDWLADIKPEASVVCKITEQGRSITAEILVPDDINNEIHIYPLCGGPHTLIKLP